MLCFVSVISHDDDMTKRNR